MRDRLAVMGGATPHGGVEPSVGPKTVVVGFPRVVVVCLLALAELARRKAAAVERMNLDKVGKAEASKPPRCRGMQVAQRRTDMLS